jgi:hypothetical protein
MPEAAWLSGGWAGSDERGAVTEEHWLEPAGGAMLGVNRTVSGDRMVFFEFLRIERRPDGEIVYLAAPKGRHPATPFRMVDAGPGRLVFENPEHDYPQRIIYERAGDTLLLRIEGEEAGIAKSSTWSLTRRR